jgi:hypothetical protein
VATLTTPKYGFPYPDGAERVMDGDNAIGALAQAVENLLLPAFRDLIPTIYRSSAQLVLTQGEVAVPGCNTGFTAIQNETVLTLASFDFNVTTAGVGACTGILYVDGSRYGGGATFGPATTGRESVFTANINVVAAGAHTFGLYARKTVNGGAAALEYASLQVTPTPATYLILMRFKTQPTLLREALEDALGDVLPEGKPT